MSDELNELDELFPEDDFELIEDGNEKKEVNINMPYHPREGMEYEPRHYQIDLWDMFNKYTLEDFQNGFCEEDKIGSLKADKFGMFMKQKFKRIILSWHRRGGKDFDTWQRFLTYAAIHPGIYYYFLPEAAQARKVIFDGQSNNAERFIDFLPKELIDGDWHKAEMKVSLKNGSLIQILGSDNYNSVMGSNPRGVVFSEYALCNPAAWTYIRPILRLNGGFAWFISTPRGRNHFHKLITTAREEKNKDNWHIDIKNIYDTGLMSKEEYQEEIDGGMAENKARQEYLVDFDAPIEGAYYSDQINKIMATDRMKILPLETAIPVQCSFDIGVGDYCCIVFWQYKKTGFEVIGYYQNNGKKLEHYIKVLHEFMFNNEVNIENVYFPHDMNVREFAGGLKRIQVARRNLPNQRCHILAKTSVAEGIDMVRRILPYCSFNIRKTIKTKEDVEYLLYALTSYSKKFNDKNQRFEDYPNHNWASDPADSFRYMAMACDKHLLKLTSSKINRVASMNRKGSLI